MKALRNIGSFYNNVTLSTLFAAPSRPSHTQLIVSVNSFVVMLADRCVYMGGLTSSMRRRWKHCRVLWAWLRTVRLITSM